MYSIHLCNVPPGTGQNSQNLQDTWGTMARDIRYIEKKERCSKRLCNRIIIHIKNQQIKLNC